MADKSTQLLIDALQRAMADPAGMPLYGTKPGAGLFANSASGRMAAQLGKDQGYLSTLRTERKGKVAQEICAITEHGLKFLLAQVSPKGVLASLVQALDARHAQLAQLLENTQQTRAAVEALKGLAEKTLQQLQEPAVPAGHVCSNGNGADAGSAAILAHLASWQSSGALGDCPLPELFRGAGRDIASLTVGQFHDALRRLQERGQVYLHPWTGPLHEIPEPAFALMAGHEIAYYASVRH
jgi:hypothetical protein